jgi:hypothetical protein
VRVITSSGQAGRDTQTGAFGGSLRVASARQRQQSHPALRAHGNDQRHGCANVTSMLNPPAQRACANGGMFRLSMISTESPALLFMMSRMFMVVSE